MAKWLGIGLCVVLLAIGTAGYVLNNGAPAPPRGVCPALVSAAPFDANIIAYADLTPLRSADFSKQFQAFTQSPQAASYRDFVEKTNFHVESDLDQILVAGSTESQSGALILNGRFDQPKITAFAATFATIKHNDVGDLYDLRDPNAPVSAEFTSMMFLAPTKLAFAAGRDPHTEMLMLADSAKQLDPNLHADMCERAERVAGASFFMLGDVPKSAMAQITPVVARTNPTAADLLQNLRGWDLAYWIDGDTVRMAAEAQFDSTYDAIRARFGFDDMRRSMEKQTVAMKSVVARNPAAPVFDTLAKNVAVTVDGRYLRIGTSVKKSDLQTLAASAASSAQHGRM